jgi:hypothetical protein
MKKFYTIEQIPDCLVVSTRTAQIGDQGPGRTGALVSHQQVGAPRCARMQKKQIPELNCGCQRGPSGRSSVAAQARQESTKTRKDSAIFGWPCGEFEMSHIKPEDVLMNQQSVRQNQQPAPKQPTEYTKEIGETICGRLVEDENLRSICAEPGMPDLATISSWISNNGEFRDMYALAREFQAHCIADESNWLMR